jgi:hypothetical protein
MGEIKLSTKFQPHRKAHYAGQRATCGCWCDSLSGSRVGEYCESRLTGPRCEQGGCKRPRGHWGECEP